MLIKRSDGEKSTSVTFAWISLLFCIFCISLGLIEDFTFGSIHIKIRMIDPLIVAALLGPTFGLYGYRRYLNPINRSTDLRK